MGLQLKLLKCICNNTNLHVNTRSRGGSYAHTWTPPPPLQGFQLDTEDTGQGDLRAAVHDDSLGKKYSQDHGTSLKQKRQGVHAAEDGGGGGHCPLPPTLPARRTERGTMDVERAEPERGAAGGEGPRVGWVAAALRVPKRWEALAHTRLPGGRGARPDLGEPLAGGQLARPARPRPQCTGPLGQGEVRPAQPAPAEAEATWPRV